MNSIDKYSNCRSEDSLSYQFNNVLSKYDNGESESKNESIIGNQSSFRIGSITQQIVAQMKLDDFKLHLKSLMKNNMASPTPKRNTGPLPQKDSDEKNCSYQKTKKMYKSRQVSMNTNACLTTDAGDTISKQELTQSKQKPKKQGGSLCEVRPFTEKTKHSMFNNTVTTLITNFDEEQKGKSSFAFDVEAFQKKVQDQQMQIIQDQLKIKKRLVTNDDQIKLRSNLRRKMKPVIEDGAMIPMNILYIFITYDGQLLKKFLLLSKGMYKHLLFYLYEQLRPIQSQFSHAFGLYFDHQLSYISQSPISFCKESGTLCNYVMRVKTKPECKRFKGKSVILSCQYKNQNEEDYYLSQYQFDVFGSRDQRWMWMHKDESLVTIYYQYQQFHGFSDARAYTIPIMPVCVEDDFEISINLQSLIGCLDIPSVKWLPIKVEGQPPLNDVRDYNRFKNLTPNRDLFQKYFADLKRVCEVEDTIIEWFNEQYVNVRSLKSHILRKIDLEEYLDQFQVLEQEVGGIDFSVWKIQLKALKQPRVQSKYYEELNIEIRVCDSKVKGLCNEVKRTGFLIDRGAPLELRGGDILLLYVSMGGFEK